MNLKREVIIPDQGSSFKILLTPGLNDTFLWHFHPEYEIVYVEGSSGTRHVGDHISLYEQSDLVFIGPYIPHLNFDYGVRTECEQIIIQLKENFLGNDFLHIPEFLAIKALFHKADYGLSFTGDTKKIVAGKLKQLPGLNHFDQLILLLQIFQLLATTDEVVQLNSRPARHRSFEKDEKRMDSIYRYIQANYRDRPDVNAIAKQVNLTTAAFCRFFRKHTKMTFTDFINQFRINQAKNHLLQDKSISEATYEVGFESVSYFNKVFKKVVGENPSSFKKRYVK
ncbi:MAG TPA: AraC family transcriptional regulator [Puia sp.]|nr:AraC family transcriptional regulator [Puia sp.]